jgi:hypothetical protein
MEAIEVLADIRQERNFHGAKKNRTLERSGRPEGVNDFRRKNFRKLNCSVRPSFQSVRQISSAVLVADFLDRQIAAEKPATPFLGAQVPCFAKGRRCQGSSGY